MRKKIVWVGIAVAIVITLIFFLYPRNLKHIFTKNIENAEITLYEPFNEQSAKKLSTEEEENLLSAMNSTKVRRKFFPNKVFHSLSVYSVMVFIPENNGEGRWITAEYYPYEEILSFGKGKGQYVFYHDDFTEVLLSLMNTEQ